MSNIILDLEWNEPMTASTQIPPVKEIIQIGAVRLEDEHLEDQFQMLVRPERFPRIHWRIRKLTGLTTAQVARGIPFPQAAEAFRRWCGPEPRLLTWGFDDIPVLLRNLALWDLPDDWCRQWYNLQLIFCHQTEQGVRQRSLEYALDYYGIERTLPLHDALHDALYTAQVCQRIDLQAGLAGYTALQSPPKPPRRRVRPPRTLRQEQGGLSCPAAALEDPVLGSLSCPRCGALLQEPQPWKDVGRNRYFALGICPEHGDMQAWIRLIRQEDDTWRAVKEITRCGAAERQYYQRKDPSAPKRKKHRSRRRKTEPSSTEETV